MRINYYLFLFLIFVGYGSCASDSTEKTSKAPRIEGHWELVEAYRSGRKTESLGGTYFTFTDDKMSTNLPINGAIDSPYTNQDNIISQSIINDIKINYTIQELSQENLRLNTKLRGVDFSFLLERKMKEEIN